MGRRMVATYGPKGETRVFIPEAGQIYRVVPMNPQKMRNRGRLCELVFDGSGEAVWYDLAVAVRYFDNGRRGRADPGDLLPATPTLAERLTLKLPNTITDREKNAIRQVEQRATFRAAEKRRIRSGRTPHDY